jgi:amidohydrolase
MADYLAEAKELEEKLIAWRRDFHMHPELAYEEHRTAEIVAEHLKGLGYHVKTGVGQTGVVGLLEGAEAGPVVMLRFDMDALPVTEETGAEYASQIEGKMHACGHDAHVAMGMGLAEMLVAHQAEMKGVAKLIFQPAEEGGNGAEKMIQDGVLENPRPDVFLSAHVWSEKEFGSVHVTPGPVMAAVDKFLCTIRGQGGHGAIPHLAVDPIVAAAQVITALQTVVSRNVDPLDTAVVSVGSIQGGSAFNIIPPQVELSGTIRSYIPESRETVLRRVREIVEGVAAACGAQAELELIALTPSLINHPETTEIVRLAAEAIAGAENISSGERTMGGEDAAFFTEQIPGCYFFVGAANAAKGIDASHHNPRFDIDERVMALGVAILAQAAAHYLF